jgi:hypothetical protein
MFHTTDGAQILPKVVPELLLQTHKNHQVITESCHIQQHAMLIVLQGKMLHMKEECSQGQMEVQLNLQSIRIPHYKT